MFTLFTQICYHFFLFLFTKLKCNSNLNGKTSWFLFKVSLRSIYTEHNTEFSFYYKWNSIFIYTQMLFLLASIELKRQMVLKRISIALFNVLFSKYFCLLVLIKGKQQGQRGDIEREGCGSSETIHTFGFSQIICFDPCWMQIENKQDLPRSAVTFAFRASSSRKPAFLHIFTNLLTAFFMEMFEICFI